MEATDAWASLLPDLLLDIFCRLKTTAVIRCAAACKTWRRIIIGNAMILRPCPDRYNPNLLLGLIKQSWYQGVTDGSISPAATSVATIETGCCDTFSSFISPAFSSGGKGISLSYTTLASRDGFLLLRSHRSNHAGLCLYNPMAGDCKFLPVAPIMDQYGEYVLVTRYGLYPSGTSRHDMEVQILAMPGLSISCNKEGRLSYQVFCYGGDGAAVWGPVQRSEVNKALLRHTHSRITVVGRDAVHWLGGTRGVLGCRFTCTVGLNIDTGRAWTTELPKQCQFYYGSIKQCALTSSGNGRLSLLQPLPDEHHIQVWVLHGDVNTMEWTMQHRIWIDEQIHPSALTCPTRRLLGSNYVVCPRSGLLFIMLAYRLVLRIDLDSTARQPVPSFDNTNPYHYYPYEMDWSTYISKMKNF